MEIKKTFLKEKDILSEEILRRITGDKIELFDLINLVGYSTTNLLKLEDYFIFDSKELELFKKKLKIENSFHHYHTFNIKNSERVAESSYISDSKIIVGSDNVTSSEEIYNSSFIDAGYKINDSKNVVRSSNIIRSTNVSDCAAVVDSNNISDSSLIYESSNVEKSLIIAKSETVKNSIFCIDVKEIDFCLFCTQIEKEKNYIFNVPIGNHAVKALSKTIREKLGDLNKEEGIKVSNSYFEFLGSLRKFPMEFWEWVTTLPHFDPVIMYRITLLPFFLKM